VQLLGVRLVSRKPCLFAIDPFSGYTTAVCFLTPLCFVLLACPEPVLVKVSSVLRNETKRKCEALLYK